MCVVACEQSAIFDKRGIAIYPTKNPIYPTNFWSDMLTTQLKIARALDIDKWVGVL